MADCINIVTIVAKNYLAQARTLVSSFKKYHPDGQAFVLLADRVDGYFDPAKEDFTLIEIDQLSGQIDNLDTFCFQYSILELSTALKPYVLKYLFQQYNLAKLVYFDPDILITGKLDRINELLDNYNIVLTPHITSPYQDNQKPSEVELLQAGAYNLGFIALSNTEIIASMLGWWEKRLYRRCLVDFSRGLFVDQKWIDLVPGLFPGTYILRDPGYNVAYWNLHERIIKIEGENVTCNTEPLYFFHFSGYSPDRSHDVSKHQDRHNFANIGHAAELFSFYNKQLMQNGYQRIKKWPYAFAVFDNGIAIPEAARRMFLNLEESQATSFGNPFQAASQKSFFKWLISINPTRMPPLLLEIYRSRPDLQKSFPDIEEKDKFDYLFWFLKDGVVQHNLDEHLLDEVKAFLKEIEVSPKKDNDVLVTADYDYSRRWNKVRSWYYSMRGYPIIRLFVEKLKPFVVKRFKRSQRIPLVDEKLQYALVGNSTEHLNYPDNEVLGVNLAGYANSEKGMGEAIRSDIRCLQQTSFPFVLNNFVDSGSVNQEMVDAHFATSNPYSINLIHVNADQVPEFIEQKGRSYLQNRYNIGYWAWELSNFPEEWHDSFRVFNEIWVPSSFVQDSLARISPIPVIKIPHSINTKNDETPVFDRSYFGLLPNSFIFFFMFDFDSFAARKNPFGIVEAFRKAFSSEDDVTLVLKSSHSEHHPDDYQALMTSISDDKRIAIVDKVMTGEEVRALMHQADCYVSLHRSEGFGLTMAEAMGMGKPVIATAYSGNTDFMTPGNCYPVKYNLVRIDQDYGPYKQGWTWADPDIDHAATLMRHVFNHQEEAMKIGQAAREYIEKYLSPVTVGQIYQQRLGYITQMIKDKKTVVPVPTDNQDAGTSQECNQEMDELQQKTIAIDVNKIPVGSKKPIVGFLLSYYKRFVRKSTFWLLEPLISRQRDLDNQLIQLHQKSLDMQKLLDNKVDKNLETLQRELSTRIEQQIQQAIEVENALRSRHQDLLTMIEQQGQQIVDQKQSLMSHAEQQDLQIAEIERQIDENDQLLLRAQQDISQAQQDISQAQQDINNIWATLRPLIYVNEGLQLPATETFDYFSFEKVFRGSSVLLKERQAGYIELFKHKRVVLDVGCGRGEFLELLKEAGIDAVGVDINEEMAGICRQKGLKVVHADFMDYLSGIPDGSLDGIFSAQFIEHISPEQIHAFFRCAYKKLSTDGIIVAETVNPYNLDQFRFFWVDPTHVRPIYPEVAKFLGQTAGFQDVRISYLPRYGETRTDLREPWDYGDYIVIAVKK